MTARAEHAAAISRPRRAEIVAALAAALIASFSAIACARGEGTDASAQPPAQDIPDLTCPSEAPALPKPQSAKPAPSRMQMPSVAELGSLARPVEQEPTALDPAKTAAFALREGVTLRPRRFAFWGDSHIAAGPLMPTLAHVIRDQGATVGIRFLPPTMGRVSVRLPIRAYCIGRSWTTSLSYLAPGVFRTGPALANRSTPAGVESYLWLDLRNSQRQPTIRKLRIVYQPTGEDTELTYAIDGAAEQHAVLASTPVPGDEAGSVLELNGTGSISTLELRVDKGQFVLLGFVLDYIEPPLVTLDVFGLPSSTSKGWANVSPAYLSRSLDGGGYDAIVLEYGTNEGNVAHFDRDKYAAGLSAALTNLRSVFPAASCILIGPPDRGVLVPAGRRHPPPTDLLKFARIHQDIAALQAEVGRRYDCVAWNWQQLMGGLGGSYGWAHNEPPYMGPDLTHLSAAGYELTAKAFAKSLGWDTPAPAPALPRQ